MTREDLHLFSSIIEPKKKLFWMLVVLIVLSIFLESFSFAMIIPFFEAFLGTDSGSALSKTLHAFFDFANIPFTITSVSIIFFVLTFLKNALILARESLRSYIAYDFQANWMNQILSSYLQMPYEQFVKEKHGKLADIVLSETIKGSVGVLQLTEYLTTIITIPFFVLILFFANPELTLYGVLAGAVLGLFSKRLMRHYAKQVGDKELDFRQQISAEVIEKLGAMRHLRTFSMEEKFRDLIFKKATDLKNLIVGWDVYTAASNPIIETLLVLSVLSYLLVSVNIHGIEYFKQLLPVVSMMLIVTQKVLGKVSRVFVNRMVIDRYTPSFRTLQMHMSYRQDRTAQTSGQSDFVRLSQKLSFQNVSFQFDRHPVLDKLSFSVNRGEKVAIIGSSGSGKSTVADLILRLYVPQEGQIEIDGVDLSTFSLESWRKRLGFVSQESYLFHDTIKANILIGNPAATDDDVIEACKKAGAHDFITSLPQKYETIVGDRGAQVSGGQRQRIAIARALVRKPEILILDEATSALDLQTEEQINREIANNLKEITIIIITHREGILQFVDRVVNLKSSAVESSLL